MRYVLDSFSKIPARIYYKQTKIWWIKISLKIVWDLKHVVNISIRELWISLVIWPLGVPTVQSHHPHNNLGGLFLNISVLWKKQLKLWTWRTCQTLMASKWGEPGLDACIIPVWASRQRWREFLIPRESVPGRLTLLLPSQDKRLDPAVVAGPGAAQLIGFLCCRGGFWQLITLPLSLYCFAASWHWLCVQADFPDCFGNVLLEIIESKATVCSF